MNGQKLIDIMDPLRGHNAMNPHAHLPRYAAMCGFFDVPAMNRYDYRIYDIDKIDVPDEIVPKILALYFAERANNDLRAMGEGIGKCKVEIPSNINVWQHLKGESALTSAAKRLSEVAQEIANR